MVVLFILLQTFIEGACKLKEGDYSGRSEAAQRLYSSRVDKACTLIKSGNIDAFFQKGISPATLQLVYDAIVDYIASAECATGSIETLLSMPAMDMLLTIKSKATVMEIDASDADRESSSEVSDRGDESEGSTSFSEEEQFGGHMRTGQSKPGIYYAGSSEPPDVIDSEDEESVILPGRRRQLPGQSAKKRKSTKILHSPLANGWAKSIVSRHYMVCKMKTFVGSQPAVIIFPHDKIPSVPSLLTLISDACQFAFYLLASFLFSFCDWFHLLGF